VTQFGDLHSHTRQCVRQRRRHVIRRQGPRRTRWALDGRLGTA
jgi:hypothetical protein